MENLAFALGMMTGGLIALAGMALRFMATRAGKHTVPVTNGLSGH